MIGHTTFPTGINRGAAWAGRASQHRRLQVSRRSEVVRMQALWESLVEVLGSIESHSSALLCTTDGVPVAAYGLPRTDLPRVSAETGTAFASLTLCTDAGHGPLPGEIETVELTAGQRHTVIASVPGIAQVDHLFAVTAEAVSLPLLQAWARRAAEDLREALAAEAS